LRFSHGGRGHARGHEHVQGVDLVEGVEAGVLGRIARVVGVVEAREPVVSTGKRRTTRGRAVLRQPRGGPQVLHGDELRALVDRQLDVVLRGLVHGKVLEDLDDLALVADDQVETARGIERAVFDLHLEAVPPDALVHGEDTEGVLGVLAAGEVRGGGRLDDPAVRG
jgi:hypothetical protein